jgi:hypothetical protein
MTVIAQRPRRTLGIGITGTGWGRVLLLCGAAASLLYFAMDVAAALLYDGYSYTGQTISELSAIDAPTRTMWIPLGAVYAVLMIAFGVGVWASAGERRPLRVVAVAVVVFGLLGLGAWPFAPMHQREVLAAGGGTFSDDLHLILSGVDGVLFFVAAAAGAMAFGRRFRLYSIVTIVVVFVFGFLMSLQAPAVQDNESTPWIGVTERIMLYSAYLWYAVLAVVLMRMEGARSQRGVR